MEAVPIHKLELGGNSNMCSDPNLANSSSVKVATAHVSHHILRITCTLKKVICHHNIHQILVTTVIYLRRFHKSTHDIVLAVEAILLNHFTNLGRSPCLEKRITVNTERYRGAILMTMCNTKKNDLCLLLPHPQCPDQVKTDTMQ